MSGCLQHLLLSFQFDQVFHDSSCIHSSPLLPTFEQKTPFSNPITVLRIKCGIPWTCWEETDCGLHHHPLPSLCCFHLFSRTLLVPCQPQKAPVCSMSGIFAHNMLFPGHGSSSLSLRPWRKHHLFRRKMTFNSFLCTGLMSPLFPCNYSAPLSFM